MVVLLNKNSNKGRGLRRWKRIQSALEEKYFEPAYTVFSDIEDLKTRLHRECTRGERFLIAAGGDGTVNYLLNEIMRMPEALRRELIFGAVGLGSSNDFHKPFSEEKFLDGIPLRLDRKNAFPHNLGEVVFLDENGFQQKKYFIINCSIGIIACANHLFNSEEKMVNWLKPRWVMGAIWYAGLKTLLTAPNIPARISIGGNNYEADVTNLSVVINPHFSGNFRYDFEISSTSDFFGIALCEKMRFPARLRTIISLAKGKFTGLPETKIFKSSSIEIYPEILSPLELDGEVFRAKRVKIELLKGALRVCR